MAETHLSLSWDAHQNNICSGLSLLQQRGEFVDMTLAADGHHVKVHQMVLSLVSPYIKDLIATAQCPHPVIFLNNISYSTLSSILEYIYTGETLLPKESLPDLIAAGKALHIKGLKDMFDEQSDAPEEPELDPEKEPIPKTFDNLQKRKENKQKSLEPTCKIFIDENNDQSVDITDDPVEMSDASCTNDEEIRKSVIRSTKTLKDLNITGALNTANENMHYSFSNQGGLQIIVNRYVYTLKYVQKSSLKFWRCADASYRKCPAKIYTNQKNQVVRRTFTHSHPFHDKKILKKLNAGIIFSMCKDAETRAQSKKSKTTARSSRQDTDSE